MFAAFTDGISPKIIPISVENSTAITIETPLIATGTAETPDIMYVIPSEIQGIAGLTKTIAEVARTETSVAKEKEVK